MFNFDIEFIEKLKKQDKSAFNEFYLKSVDIFFGHIQGNFGLDRNESYDIISDFYVKFWENINKYKEKNTFSAYVRTIFKNTLKDYFKKKKELTFTELSNENMNFEDTLVHNDEILNFMEQDFQLEQIDKAISYLNPSEQEILYLKFTQEQSYKEISEILGITEDNIRQRIFRVIKKLKKLL